MRRRGGDLSKVHREIGRVANELETFDPSKIAHLEAFNAANLEILETEYKFCSEQVSSWAKWLTASLLVINSGALLAALNSDEINARGLAASIFVAGVVTALLSGTVLQEIYNRHGDLVRAQWVEFKKFEAGFSLDQAKLSELSDKHSWWERIAPIAPILGYLSGCFFVAGALTAFFL